MDFGYIVKDRICDSPSPSRRDFCQGDRKSFFFFTLIDGVVHLKNYQTLSGRRRRTFVIYYIF